MFFQFGICIYIHVPPSWIFRIPGKENALLGEIPLGFWRFFFNNNPGIVWSKKNLKCFETWKGVVKPNVVDVDVLFFGEHFCSEEPTFRHKDTKIPPKKSVSIIPDVSRVHVKLPSGKLTVRPWKSPSFLGFIPSKWWFFHGELLVYRRVVWHSQFGCVFSPQPFQNCWFFVSKSGHFPDSRGFRWSGKPLHCTCWFPDEDFKKLVQPPQNLTRYERSHTRYVLGLKRYVYLEDHPS